jgi:hypothetical protein
LEWGGGETNIRSLKKGILVPVLRLLGDMMMIMMMSG